MHLPAQALSVRGRLALWGRGSARVGLVGLDEYAGLLAPAHIEAQGSPRLFRVHFMGYILSTRDKAFVFIVSCSGSDETYVLLAFYCKCFRKASLSQFSK